MEENLVINYGIIAVDKREVESGGEEGSAEILHFCGYANEPSTEDYESLLEELSTDEEFGLIKIIEHIVLLEAPSYIIEHYRKIAETPQA